MKQNIKNHSIITIALLVLSLITSFILALLSRYNLLSYNTSIIISNSFAYLYIAIFTFLLGLKVKKHGLLHGMIFSVFLILFTMIIGNKIDELTTIIKIIIKSIIAIFFTILGVNKKNPN